MIHLTIQAFTKTTESDLPDDMVESIGKAFIVKNVIDLNKGLYG